MADVVVEMKGMDRLVRLLATGGDKSVDALARALYEEAQVIFEKSQQIVPHEEGVLAASGQLHPPSVYGSDIIVEITYGGNASAYAAIQHEVDTFRHAPGRQSHYLEQPFMESLDNIEGNVYDRVDAILRGLI